MCSSQAACPYILECTSMFYSVMWSRAGPRDTMIPLVPWCGCEVVTNRSTHDTLISPLHSTHCPSKTATRLAVTLRGFYSSPKFHYKRDPYKYAVHLAINPQPCGGFQILVNGLIVNIMLSYSPTQEASS